MAVKPIGQKGLSSMQGMILFVLSGGVQRVQPFDGLLRQSLDAWCRSKTPAGLQGQSPAGSKAKPGPVRMSLRHTVLGIA